MSPAPLKALSITEHEISLMWANHPFFNLKGIYFCFYKIALKSFENRFPRPVLSYLHLKCIMQS